MSGATQDQLPVSESPWQQVRKRFMQTRMGPAGLAVLISIFIFVVLGSLLLPYDFYVVPQPDVINFVGRPPAWGRPFGETGMLQLDVLTLVANGGRTSLIIGFATAIGSITIGTFVGVIAGFIGGKVDSFLMRLADVFLMIPSLFVILFLARIFQGEGGGGVWSLVIVFVGFGWMGLARLVRGQVLAIREMEFVEAARALGVPPLRIALRHILPNAIGPLVVAAPFIVGGAIVSEAFISYLGFGVNPATPTWGNILSESSKFLQQGNWWWIGFPGLFIVLTSLSINMIGDTLRSALDPRGRK
ncbi:MAG: ABC transporter permease [Chloroflexi bacterium]|nr:ABC transporter permease [Chloroflexota bacterium]